MKAFISILTTISPTIYLNFHDTNLHIQFYEEKWYVQDVDWIIQKYHAVIWSKSSQTEIKSLSGWKSFQTYVSIPFDRVDMFIFYIASCFHIKFLRLAWHYTFYTIILLSCFMWICRLCHEIWLMHSINFYSKYDGMVNFPWTFTTDCLCIL